jgi:hypothetical protein
MSNIMHLSYYVKAYSYDEPEYLVLYSIRTGSVILLEKEVLDRVQSGNLSPSEQELLVEMGYLVEDIEN